MELKYQPIYKCVHLYIVFDIVNKRWRFLGVT